MSKAPNRKAKFYTHQTNTSHILLDAYSLGILPLINSFLAIIYFFYKQVSIAYVQLVITLTTISSLALPHMARKTNLHLLVLLGAFKLLIT